MHGFMRGVTGQGPPCIAARPPRAAPGANPQQCLGTRAGTCQGATGRYMDSATALPEPER
jgi:hypothetical protein